MPNATNTGEHDALASMWSANQFEPTIRHIRFPHFRNLEAGLRIDFLHPITVLVGPNGTNKSSILRALQGCPEGQNIGRFWFGTPLDVIPSNERHRFIYGRWSDSAHSIVEIVQIRRARQDTKSGDASPDYFETNAPLVSDGMAKMPPITHPLPSDRTGTRWKSIEKDVVYFDFRAEISAFDKFFYHNDSSIHGRSVIKYEDQLRARKEFLASKSKDVKNVLDRKLSSYRPSGRELVVQPPRSLTHPELGAVSKILGRSYTEIEFVNHRAFRATGVTARISTGSFGYTEAWAGSGEFAVIRLVTLISECSDKSLVLLDEPEVSLHPGAQSRLIQFLVESAKKKRLQIVIATHSPAIVDALPAPAIKVLDRSDGGKITLRAQESYSSEAFAALEHHPHRKTIFVEDRLAKAIVLHVLRQGGENRLQSVDVKIQPGGHTTLRARSLPLWATEGRKDVLILLDGDQQKEPPPPPETIPECDLERQAGEVLQAAARNNIPANTGGPDGESYKTIIDFGRKYVRYLPGDVPDAWLTRIVDPTATNIGDGKLWWNNRTKALLRRLASESVSSDEQFLCQEQAVAQIPSDHPDILEIKKVVEEFLNR